MSQISIGPKIIVGNTFEDCIERVLDSGANFGDATEPVCGADGRYYSHVRWPNACPCGNVFDCAWPFCNEGEASRDIPQRA
jgi:hypothetical protein